MRLPQIAKKKWLKEGDHYSKFVNALISTQRNKVAVSHMRLKDGSILDSIEVIHEEMVRYFNNFLTE